MSGFPYEPNGEHAEVGARLLDALQTIVGQIDEPVIDHRGDVEDAKELLSLALSELMHFAAQSGAAFDLALEDGYATYLEARGATPRQGGDAVTDGQRYGFVLGVQSYRTETQTCRIQFLGELAPDTVNAEELTGVDPPQIPLGSWSPDIHTAVSMLASYQSRHELLTEYGLTSPFPGPPTRAFEHNRVALLHGLSSWARIDEERLLAGLRPAMDKIRPMEQQALEIAFKKPLGVAAQDFTAARPSTDGPLPEHRLRPPGEAGPPSPRPSP